MKKILFLLDELPPTKSANGICVDKIISALKRDGCEVSCICWKAPEQYQAEVHLIPEKPWKQKVDKFSTGGKLFRAYFQVLRVLYRLKRVAMLSVWPVDSYKTVKNFYKTARSLIECENISVVVAVNYPGETLLAMKYLKKHYAEKICTVMYPLDVSYVNPYCGKIERKISSILCPKFMKMCSKYADALLVLENAQEIYNKLYDKNERNNFRICGIPLLEPAYIEEKTLDSAEIHCVYSGTLQRKIRDPEYAFTILNKIAKEKKYKIIFDLYGQVDQETKELYEKAKYVFEFANHGWVEEEQLEKCLQRANVLISLGNMESHLIPSKLFKYMAMRKPIIHFCLTKRDPCIPYLEKYKNAKIIFLNDNMKEKQMEELAYFIKQAPLANIELEKCFPRCIPSYTAKLIEELVK